MNEPEINRRIVNIKEEEDDKCKETMHKLIALLFICQGSIIILSLYNIYRLTTGNNSTENTSENENSYEENII